MKVCEKHSVVYEDKIGAGYSCQCPCCEMQEEIDRHERTNEELRISIKELEETVNYLREYNSI